MVFLTGWQRHFRIPVNPVVNLLLALAAIVTVSCTQKPITSTPSPTATPIAEPLPTPTSTPPLTPTPPSAPPTLTPIPTPLPVTTPLSTPSPSAPSPALPEPTPTLPPSNRPPQILGSPKAIPTEIAANGTVQLQAIAQDPDGDPFTFSWSQSPAQPAGQFSNPTSAFPAWTAPEVAQPTTFALGVTVSDDRGGQDKALIQVRVNPGAKASRPPQTFTFWQDPNEMAFKVLVPVDWQVSGGLQRVNTDPTYQFEARKRNARFFLQNPVPVQNWVPTQYTAMLGYQEGTYIPALGFQFFLLRYHPPREYISRILLAGLKQQYPDARILEFQDLPEVAKLYKDPSATMAEAASATIAFTDGVTPTKAGFTVWTDYFAGPEGSAAWVARVLGTIAPEREFQVTTQFLAMALASLRIEPAWLAAEIQGAATRRAMVRAAANRIREMEYKMFQEERNINLKIGGNWMEALGPNFHTRDKNGNPTILPNPGAGRNWGEDDRGNFQPYDGNIPPEGISPLKPLQ